MTTRRLLVVLDRAKGLRAAVRDVFGADVPVQHCQWHKRENVVSYLTSPCKSSGVASYSRLRAPVVRGCEACVQQLIPKLAKINESAARSLEEGLEETLTLHGLGVFVQLGTSFKTTNLIESVMARVEAKTRRVGRWRTSDQKQRWCADTLLQIEHQFRRVHAYQKLPLLQRALNGTLSLHIAAA